MRRNIILISLIAITPKIMTINTINLSISIFPPFSAITPWQWRLMLLTSLMLLSRDKAFHSFTSSCSLDRYLGVQPSRSHGGFRSMGIDCYWWWWISMMSNYFYLCSCATELCQKRIKVDGLSESPFLGPLIPSCSVWSKLSASSQLTSTLLALTKLIGSYCFITWRK